MIYVRQSTHVSNTGIGFLGALTLLFVALKLTGVIGWSWWLVTLPLWIIPAVLLGFGLFAALIWVSVLGWQSQGEKRRRRKRMALGS